jgi:hypothetical protein
MRSSVPYRVPAVRAKDRFNKIDLIESEVTQNAGAVDKVSEWTLSVDSFISVFICTLVDGGNTYPIFSNSRCCVRISLTTSLYFRLRKGPMPVAASPTPMNVLIGRMRQRYGRQLYSAPMNGNMSL